MAGTLPEPVPPPDPEPAPAPAPPMDLRSRPQDITCGFCGCRLTATRGEVLRMSPEAIAFRNGEQELADVKAQLAKRDARIAELTPTPVAPTGKKKTFEEELFSK